MRASLTPIVQRSTKLVAKNDRWTILNGIILDDRWTILNWDCCRLSVNDLITGWLTTIVKRSAKRGDWKRSFDNHKRNRWIRSFNDRQKVSLKTIVQQLQKGFVENNCSTVVKRDRCNDRSTIQKRYRRERSFNDLQKRWLSTTVHQSCHEVVANDRLTITQWDGRTQSFNDRKTSELRTNFSTIVWRDSRKISFNYPTMGSL